MAELTDQQREGAAFDRLLAQVDHPMLIVTTVAGDERAGCLVGFHSQCSIDPPRYAIWLSKANRTFRVGAFASVFALHVLEVRHQALATLFGGTTGDDDDKFARCGWHAGLDGVPILDECAAYVVGRQVAAHDDGGDHICVVVEPQSTHAPDESDACGTNGRLVTLQASALTGLQPGHDAAERQTPG